MMTSFFIQTIYKLIHSKVTLILVLSISSMLFSEAEAQEQEQEQVICNEGCSNQSGKYIYINENSNNGLLEINGVKLTGYSIHGNSNSTIRFPLNSISQSLIADRLTIQVQASDSKNYARAVNLYGSINDNEITAIVKNSYINLEHNYLGTKANTNVIGILGYSSNSGQTYNINLISTDINVISTKTNDTWGIYTISASAKKSIVGLNGKSTIKVTGEKHVAGISFENSKENQISDVSANSSITVESKDGEAQGIYIVNGESTLIENKSNISATSTNSNAYGISTGTDETTITTEAGNITVTGGSGAYGIYTESQVKSNIKVANKIDASNKDGKNGTGIYSKTANGENSIELKIGSNIIGGKGSSSAGVHMENTSGGNQTLNLLQGSQISSLNDLALSSKNTDGNTKINNNGQITGYAELTGNDVVFNNESDGIIDLKNFSSGSKNKITYNVGSSNGTLNNRGIIKFADENFDGTKTNAVFDFGDKGDSGDFNHYGIIYLTGKNLEGNNNLVGDTLTINGNYVSNGGSIYLNTLLDDASSNDGHGTSDLIIVNGNVSTGSGGATKLYIIPTANSANLGQLTTGNGIKVVEVNSESSNDAFKLSRPVLAGAYEYTLAQGKTDNSWYLSSYYKGIPNENDTNDIIQYSPAMGAYLANQTAAVQMFQQTLFDRLISSPDGKNNDASKNLFWMKTKIAQGSYDSINDGLSNRNRSYSLQIGGDFNVWKLNNDGYFHLGAMGGYGYSKNSIKSNTTGTKIDGNVKGYSAGLYGTYFANKDSKLNLYVDLWSQMGWYNNDVSGEALLSNQKYNSTVWSNSVELGYGIPLGVNGEYQWLATPQAQFTYNYYDVDNQHDKNNLHVSNSHASGLDTRLGIRLDARGVQKELIEPFLEVNWLDTTAKNKLDFDDKSYKDGFSKNRIEANVGLQGNVSERLSISTQMGMRLGNNSYNNYQGQLNLNYRL